MKPEWQLFNELTGIDDDLLRSADGPAKPEKHRRFGLRAGLVAAVIVLLATTVAAVQSVYVKYGRQTVVLEGVSLAGGISQTATYHTAEIQTELEVQKIQNLSILQDSLTDAWENFPYEAQYFTTAEALNADGERLTFDTMTEAGAYFGLRLMHSPTLDRITRRVTVTLVVSDTDRAAQEYRETGSVTPDGLLLQCVFRQGDELLDPGSVAECTLTVTVALQPSFVDEYGAVFLSSYEKEGAFRESGMLTDSRKSLLLLENAPAEGYSASGYAVWCVDGITYRAILRTLPNATATPLSILTPLLRDLN